jgi:OmcA/MtrC family decaheme c-type cytochrome
MNLMASGITVLKARASMSGILLLSTLLVACGGGGSSGNSNPGENLLPPVDINDAAEINAAITGATISSSSVAEFVLTNETGNPVTGLPASSISFVLAKLVPGTDGNPGFWQSYINKVELPGVGPGTESKLQATTENGAAGELVERSNGSYVYTFALDVTNVTEPAPIEYIPTITHRLSFEIRGYTTVRNPYYDFRPSGGGLLFQRNMATIETCNTCHGDLTLHGGARNEVQNCVTCHNPGSADANSGNTVDMTVMTHKIHFGKNLPSVIAGGDYCIYGFRDIEHCYGDVSYTGDITDCSGCHDEDDPKTPQAARWYQVPSADACGSCHDDVNFVTGENHGENGSAGPADNTGCITCHAAKPDSPIEVRNAHQNAAREAAAAYRLNILGVAFSGPTTAPTVTFSVTNPLENDAPYDLVDNAEAFSRLRFYVAWNTIEYSNIGLNSSNSQPESTNVYASDVLQASDNLDGSYDLTLTAVSAGVTGSGVVTLEGYVEDAELGRLLVTSVNEYFSITDPQNSPVARRKSVDIDLCSDCHAPLTFHGSARNDSVEVCQVCHIPDAARRNDSGPMDMKYFVHRIHAVDDILYPQPTSNCLACHTDTGFYPVPLNTGILATSTTRGTDDRDPTDNNRYSPNSAACVVCHEGGRGHMEGRGGSFDACQESDGTLRVRVDICGTGGDKSGNLITEGGCVNCHGPGGQSDVAEKHGLNL